MNDELRAALDKLDAALAEARAAMEPEHYTVATGAREGVPCPPATVTLDVGTIGTPGSQFTFASITSLTACNGGAYVEGTARKVGHDGWNDDKVVWARATPAEIRAACAEKGVPCVAEKPPRGVVVQCGGRDIRLATIDEIGAGVCPGAGPRLYVKLGSCLSWTTTPLADIIAQAKAAEMELPNVTVKCSGWTWTRIDMVTVEARSNDTLDTTIVGVSDSGTGKEFQLSSARTTPAQVCQLCELAGWPRPKVLCVFTHCDGSPCEYAPRLIGAVTADISYHATKVAHAEADTYCSYVREPVPVVQRMIDACREGE
jgi:hypothetical protein